MIVCTICFRSEFRWFASAKRKISSIINFPDPLAINSPSTDVHLIVAVPLQQQKQWIDRHRLHLTRIRVGNPHKFPSVQKSITDLLSSPLSPPPPHRTSHAPPLAQLCYVIPLLGRNRNWIQITNILPPTRFNLLLLGPWWINVVCRLITTERDIFELA